MKRDNKEETVDIVPLMPYIVHQLKTPLTSISGFADILIEITEGKLSNKERDFLKNIAISGGILLEMLNSISEFSKLESGERTVNPHNFSLYDVAESLVEEFSPAASEKGVAIEISGKHIQVFADFGMVQRAAKAFLDNAIKHTSSGGKIAVAVNESSDYDEITVSDNGCGMPEEFLNNLFDVSYQIENHTSNTGIGLGLAIAKRAIELQGGSIIINSAEGKGTTATLRLPKK